MHFSIEPHNIIQAYLNIPLNEITPCIYIHNRKIEAISFEDYTLLSIKKINQYTLFTKVIENLRNEEFTNSNTFYSKSCSQSSSTDSLAAYLGDDPFVNLASEYKVVRKVRSLEDRIFLKSQLILKIALESISVFSEGNVDKEKFHSLLLALALECHMNLYLKRDLSKIVKQLNIEALNVLIRFYLNANIASFSESSKSSEVSRKSLEIQNHDVLHELNDADKDLIIDNDLMKTPIMSKIYEEMSLRDLKSETHCLEEDIVRHIPNIIVLNTTKKLFLYEKLHSQKKVNDSTQYNQDISNFKRLINTFLDLFSRNQGLKNHISSKILDKSTESFLEVSDEAIVIKKNRGKLEKFTKSTETISEACGKFITRRESENDNQEETIISKKHKGKPEKLSASNENFSEVCKTFVTGLKCPTENKEETILQKKLHDMLWTLTQKTYSLTAIFIKQILGCMRIISVLGESPPKIIYKVSNTNINLITSKTLLFPQLYNFQLEITNSMKCNINDPSEWTSNIYINIVAFESKTKDDVLNKVVIPLKNLGFNVQLT